MTLPPYWEEPREPIVRAPRIVIVILGGLTLVHIATMFLPVALHQAVFDSFGFVPGRVAQIDWGRAGLNAYGLAALAPFVTYAALHGDLLHLLVNALALLAFGTVVARRIGPGRFVVLTLITTVAAALTHLFLHWGSATPVVGASGFVSGLMGGAARFIFIDPRGTTVWPRPILPLLSRPVVTFSLLFTMINFGYGLSGFAPDGFERSVAWEAHLGGFYAGLLVFPLFDRQRGWLR